MHAVYLACMYMALGLYRHHHPYITAHTRQAEGPPICSLTATLLRGQKTQRYCLKLADVTGKQRRIYDIAWSCEVAY